MATKKTATKTTASKTTAKKTTTKTTAKKAETTAVALCTPAKELAGIFDPIDFERLNASINKLVTSKGTLSPDEKQFAIGIIDEWDHSVIEAIDDKVKEGQEIEYSLDPDHAHYYQADDDKIEALATAIGPKTRKLYNEYLELTRELKCVERDAPHTDSERDLDETADEYIDRCTADAAAIEKYNIKIAKLRRKVEWALYDLKVEMSATPEVQEILRRIKTFSRKASTFRKQCQEKSRVAKINITISDNSVRDALMEIMNFKF